MLCPASDPGFAEHPIHGYEAQLPEIRQVVRLCNTRTVAVDVGAHIGIWSLELSRHFQMVHAFEPVQENFSCLMTNVARRPVCVYQVALGDRKGYCEMCAPAGGNSGMAYASEDLYEGGGRVNTVPMLTLDSFHFKDVGLIKIDVEGYEGNVLLGALGAIMESRPVIVFEDNGLGPKRYGSNWMDPKPMLLDMRYKKAVRIRKDEVWIPSP